jgi:hypothetical protein
MNWASVAQPTLRSFAERLKFVDGGDDFDGGGFGE